MTNSIHTETKRRAFEMLKQNNSLRAMELFEQACSEDSNDVESRYMLGVVCGQLQQFDVAANHFRQVIAKQSQMPMAHYGLAAALSAQGKLEEAVSSYQKVVRFMPNVPEIRLEMSNVLKVLGRLDESKSQLQDAIRLRPSVEAYLALGNIQASQGLLNEAIASYQQALKINPQRADVNNVMGFAYYLLGKYDEAIQCYQLAIKSKPDFVAAYENLGRALMMLGKIDDAISNLQAALRINPDYVPASASIVSAYELAGDYHKANEYLAPLLEKHSTNPSVVMAFLRLAKQLGRVKEAVEMAENMLRHENISPLDKRQLHFSCGKIYDAASDYDKAFLHYQNANSIQPPSYHPARHARDIDALIEVFSKEAMKNLPRATQNSERPVFIIGMPRSGTSLVEQILASHPQVHGAGELIDMGRIMNHMSSIINSSSTFPACVRQLTQTTASDMAREYLEVLASKSLDALRVTDKMPHNFICLGLINLLFPNARVIHCKRNPLDTCLSIYFQYFNDGHAYSYDLGHIGTHYRDYERLMEHWNDVLDISMLELNYEDLVTDPDRMIRKLVEFVGLEWDPVCLRFYESSRLVSTASYEQVRQPLSSKSIDRWKNYSGYLENLKRKLGLLPD